MNNRITLSITGLTLILILVYYTLISINMVKNRYEDNLIKVKLLRQGDF